MTPVLLLPLGVMTPFIDTAVVSRVPPPSPLVKYTGIQLMQVQHTVRTGLGPVLEAFEVEAKEEG